jgi:hypothetical protein
MARPPAGRVHELGRVEGVAHLPVAREARAQPGRQPLERILADEREPHARQPCGAVDETQRRLHQERRDEADVHRQRSSTRTAPQRRLPGALSATST